MEHLADLKYVPPPGDVSSSQYGRPFSYKESVRMGSVMATLQGGGGEERGVVRGGRGDASLQTQNSVSDVTDVACDRSFLADIFFLAVLGPGGSTRSCLFSMHTVYCIWAQPLD